MKSPTPIETAMLIDDESLDQKLYQRIIQRSGLVKVVLPFTYADTALEYLKSMPAKPIDVIFLDINIPRMNGFEFLTAATATLGKDFVHVVVVMLTTSLDDRDRARAQVFPSVKRFINKPLTVQHLTEVAQLLCHMRQA